MDEKIKNRGVDFINISIGKIANFLTTASVFYLVSGRTDSNEFSLFGYWWSIGTMIGGMLLGGIASAAVREIAVARTFNLVLTFLIKALVTNTIAIAFIILAIKYTAIISIEKAMFGVAVIGFGVILLLQNITFSLLRAIQDVRSNCIGSLIVAFQVPATVWIMMDKSPKVFHLFKVLTVAFGVGTIIAVVIAWRSIRGFAVSSDRSLYKVADFRADALSFTAINFLSYSSINVDFTLMKIFSTESEFATVASGKIYFERFILPILTLFASVISLRVLRHENRWFKNINAIGLTHLKNTVIVVVIIVCLLSFSYYVFHRIIRSDSPNIGLIWVSVASLGYLLFAVNGVLFDLLVVSKNTQSVLIHVIGFVVLGAVIQWSSFASFRVPGWAIGWALFNGIITVMLAPKYFRLKT